LNFRPRNGATSIGGLEENAIILAASLGVNGLSLFSRLHRDYTRVHPNRRNPLRKIFPFLILGLLFFPRPSSSAPAFFTVEWKDGKAWLQNPVQKPFLSLGVNHIGDHSYRAPNDNYYNPVKNQYGGDKKKWMKNTLARLKRWGFNTIGSWSDEDLYDSKTPFVHMLYIARGNPWERVLDSVFTEDFQSLVRENAQKATKLKDHPQLVGYFLDNELPWWGEFGWQTDGQKTLLEKYAAGKIENADKKALRKFFEDRYGPEIENFNRVWNTSFQSFEPLEGPLALVPRTKKQKADANAWAGAVAERYFTVTTKALREVDPHHLILGVRFAGSAPWEVVESCARYCDVVSVNHYQKSGNIDKVLLDNFYAKAKKPILIGEYSFSAMENQSGNLNTGGADVVVPTQKDRAEHLNRYARQILDLPYIVGLHWFEWADESPQGRFDGENCDYGLVDIHDKEYTLVTQKHTEINQKALRLHQKASGGLPEEFKAPPELDYRKAEAGTKISPSKSYLKIDSATKAIPWGDDAHESKISIDPSSGVLSVDYQSGKGWGCGFSCPSNLEPLVAPGVSDWRGYNFFQFKAFVPKSLTFMVYLSESGCAAPGAEHPGVNGADGETYSFPSFTGMGKWETYLIELGELECRTAWGNQNGNKILDLQGFGNVEFYLPANQGTGRMLVKDLEFKVK
jgi:hypothetical protein